MPGRWCEAASEALGVPRAQVLVASTGVIGRPLPIADVVAGIHEAAAEMDAGLGREAADAIRTTDAFAKLAESSVRIEGTEVRIGGMAKGAGMIRPDMATTLAQITTDAEVPRAPAAAAAAGGRWRGRSTRSPSTAAPAPTTASSSWQTAPRA